mmetsp:Transcript_40464/g.56228  ORF Transcript_40464/g.56228 Transcript_40464/m.56228 type:complete len:85 (+) Transcript_40464:151-405(+)
MRVKCLFFAQSREVVGFGSHSFDVREGINTEEFKSKYLFPLFPVLEESFENCLLAVDNEYVDPESPVSLKEGCEVAVIPPVSGG